MIKIVKYCGVWGGWGALGVGRQNLTKDNGAPAPPPSVIKIVKYCDVGRGGGIGGAKILQSIMVPPLPVIKIFTSKYGGVWGGGGGGAPKSYKRSNYDTLIVRTVAFPVQVAYWI